MLFHGEDGGKLRILGKSKCLKWAKLLRYSVEVVHCIGRIETECSLVLGFVRRENILSLLSKTIAVVTFCSI